MSLADELTKLERLRESGALSEEEFKAAKATLLQPAPPQEDPEPSRILGEVANDNSLGRAANRYVSYSMVMGGIGLIIFLIFLCTVILPAMNKMNNGPGGGPLGDMCQQPNVVCTR